MLINHVKWQDLIVVKKKKTTQKTQCCHSTLHFMKKVPDFSQTATTGPGGNLLIDRHRHQLACSFSLVILKMTFSVLLR